MNLDVTPAPKKKPVPQDEFSMDDFDFKPITSGLGFHQNKTSEIKPIAPEKPFQTMSSPAPVQKTQIQPLKPDMAVYQNDLSMFYGREAAQQAATPLIEERVEKVYKVAAKSHRVLAFVLDLLLITSVVGIMMTIMAHATDMDLMEVWKTYPNEITPLVVSLFCGFYLMYFSVFEKSSSSTLGKNLLGLRVVDLHNKEMNFMSLMLRSFITLVNFLTLGLFSYFDLQNKITSSKVIKAD
jgi:uncharacterized RDD family membrane protein YckC